MFDILTAKRMPESGVTATEDPFKDGNQLFLASEQEKARKYLEAMPPRATACLRTLIL